MTKQYAATRFERTSYDLFFSGQNIVYFILTSFLSVYYTGTLGIPATAVAGILLAARIWDAFVDPMLAAVVERSNFKSGKFRPWVLLAAITVPFFTILCFGFDGFLLDQSLSVRIAYAAITYFLWGTFYAAADAPAYALSTVMTPYPEERNLLLTYNKITGLVGGLAGMVAFPLVLSATDDNWFLTVLVFSLIAFGCMMMIRFAKERIKHVPDNPPSMSVIFKTILSNKYLVIIVIVSLIANGLNFMQTLTPFLASDIYHDSNATATLLGVSVLPMILVAPFAPVLIRKFGKINLVVISFAATAVFSVLLYFFAKESLTMFLVLSFLKGLFSAPFLVVYSLFFADCIEYDAHQKGKRFEAVTFAAQTFMAKVSAAISGGVGMWIIGIAGYKAAVEGETVTQSDTALNALWASVHWGPVVGSVIALVLFLKYYDLTDEKVKKLVESNLEKGV
ncbi:MFS transporter [Paenibacillus sp. OV219]|uniref:MFS transporter n=1 Tax=Paenibacillus sp. OV219 TaxID=1884377 RepID=UPI0008B624AF|nr:glycoside-pentoside-hexuronide (GPH):cation symporter [Paenibacillus sp. OV219]SEM56151.1 sugar (Glycoside-Pentoside-Hexuronide) transporter [Paenibacillus sp. OV219]